MIEYKSAYFNNKLYYSTLSKMKAIEDFCNKKIQEDVRFEVVAFKEINNDNDEIVLLYKQNTTKRIMRMKEFVYKSINGEHNLYDTEDNTLTLSAFYKNKLNSDKYFNVIRVLDGDKYPNRTYIRYIEEVDQLKL